MKINIMKILIIFLILAGINLKLFAHLCDDVFVQAKDNLAVKVDVRDGQLRIAKKGKFRVYLLNTMDRAIANINLIADSKEFDIEVKPAKSWSGFPTLIVNNKQFFEVTLNRKTNTTEGKYKINLTLVNGRKKSMVFKTINLEDKLKIFKVPEKKKEIKIDGQASRQEWGKSLLCTSLHECVEKKSKISWLRFYKVNRPAKIQTRFRFVHDKDFLYCLIDFLNKSKQDSATIYVATNYDSVPLAVTASLKDKSVKANVRPFACYAKFNGPKVELKIPLRFITFYNKKQFLVNFKRNRAGKISFWKGNSKSVGNPVVYGKLSLN